MTGGSSTMNTVDQHGIISESTSCHWCSYWDHYIPRYASGHRRKYYLKDALAKCLTMSKCGGVTCAQDTAHHSPGLRPLVRRGGHGGGGVLRGQGGSRRSREGLRRGRTRLHRC